MQKKFYQRLWFKNIVLIGVPSVISLLGIFTSILNGTIRIILYCVCVCLMIFLVIAVIFYSHSESKTDKIIENLETECKTYKLLSYCLNKTLEMKAYSVNIFSQFTEAWSKNINAFANEVTQRGKAPERCWEKSKLFDEVCVHCKKMIQKYCDNEDDTKISVGYINYRKDEQGEEWVSMIAHSNPETTRPHSYGEEEKLSESIYHYAELIKEKSPDIEVAVNNEEILRIFKKVSKTTDLSKYTQYIAIPIYCSQKKLTGIFQIVTKYNYIIEEDPVELRKFAEQNIIPFSNMILLIDKINKGLCAKPNEERRNQYVEDKN